MAEKLIFQVTRERGANGNIWLRYKVGADLTYAQARHLMWAAEKAVRISEKIIHGKTLTCMGIKRVKRK